MATPLPITRRSALKAALLATPAAFAAPVTVTPADTMAGWLDHQDEVVAERNRLITLAIARARAEGRDIIAAEDAMLEITNAMEEAHEARLPAMRITTPQTARRALAWADCDRAGDEEAKLMRNAVDAYLATLCAGGAA